MRGNRRAAYTLSPLPRLEHLQSFSRWPKDLGDRARLESRRVRELEPDRRGKLGEKPHAASQGDRMDDQSEFVDQARPHERLGKARAAMGEQLAARLKAATAGTRWFGLLPRPARVSRVM